MKRKNPFSDEENERQILAMIQGFVFVLALMLLMLVSLT